MDTHPHRRSEDGERMSTFEALKHPRKTSGNTGQFDSVVKSTSSVVLTRHSALTTSDPTWHDLTFNDQPSHEERRSYAISAIGEALNNDEFDVVHSPSEKYTILEAANNERILDDATDDLADCPPQHYGALLAEHVLRSANGHTRIDPEAQQIHPGMCTDFAAGKFGGYLSILSDADQTLSWVDDDSNDEYRFKRFGSDVRIGLHNPRSGTTEWLSNVAPNRKISEVFGDTMFHRSADRVSAMPEFIEGMKRVGTFGAQVRLRPPDAQYGATYHVFYQREDDGKTLVLGYSQETGRMSVPDKHGRRALDLPKVNTSSLASKIIAASNDDIPDGTRSQKLAWLMERSLRKAANTKHAPEWMHHYRVNGLD